MIRKMFSTLAVAGAMVLALGTAAMADEIAIMVPSADHGWTGAVLTYAQEKADEINAAGGDYTAKVYAATDVDNQIQQVDE